QVDNWQFTSMSGKYLDEYNYLSFSGFYPTNLGTLGLGFMGSSIGGAFSTKRDPNSSDDDPIYIIDTSQPPINYFNNVLLLSYGTNLSRFLKRFGWEKQVNLGASLKSFSAALSGDGITKGGATGMELCLGLLYDTNLPWLTLGVNLENILPASMGGKLTYETGHEETYPAAVRLGSTFRVIGKNNSVRAIGDQELKVLADYYMHPTISTPATLHLGLEYSPVPIVALRFGLDQDVIGNGLGTGVGTTGNLTSGVGFNFSGFRFDYAYNQYSWATNSSANYISMSYSPPVQEAQKNAEQVVFISPPDKQITFEAKLPFTGRVLDAGLASFTLAGKAPKMDLEGNFDYGAELTIGKNRITAIGKDRSGKPNYKRDFRALRLVVFPDVQSSYWVAQPISFLSMLNIINGYPDGSFRPEGDISRAEMCSLLMKAKGPGASSQESASSSGPLTSATGHFKDVSAKHWAAKYVAQAAALGVVKGYPRNFFKPNGKITRAEGLA
ncbi:MAG TPA: S-layer homology domain-containing protein, partial [Candidatus Sulfotelmatobacter sp.]|nr:S-layer homology domain-containing protein [Candidatus Sulfotelmatobacter sp.]